ncbi:reverse transcriptase domain-containing protein [Tanacetum coccineum]
MPVTKQGDTTIMTPETVQAMINQALQRNSTNTHDNESQNSGGGPGMPVQPTRVCSYTDFMKCQPLNFKGTDGIVGLSRCTLLGVALTWWNDHVRTLGHDVAYAMTWEIFKKKLMDKYCPKGEIKKLEIELWNLKVKGNDVGGYTQRFQELALMCPKFLSDETEKVDKYISGLPNNIHGNVMSVRPKTLDDAIELANDLMHQKLRTYAERQAKNKRKLDNNNQAQQKLLKKQNVVQAYAVGSGEKKPYGGSKPLCPNATITMMESVHPSAPTLRVELLKAFGLLRTYGERHNENKRKADDWSRNNQQQQPHKKQNVARAYTANPGEKKSILGTYLCAPSAITITLGNVHPSVENARGMVMLPLTDGSIPTTTITTTTTRIKRLGHAMNVETLDTSRRIA